MVSMHVSVFERLLRDDTPRRISRHVTGNTMCASEVNGVVMGGGGLTAPGLRVDPDGRRPLGAADDRTGRVRRGDVGGAVRELVEEEQRGAALRLQADVALGTRRRVREAGRKRGVQPRALQPRYNFPGSFYFAHSAL